MDVAECEIDEVKASEISKSRDNRVSIFIWWPRTFKSDVTRVRIIWKWFCYSKAKVIAHALIIKITTDELIRSKA